MKPSVLGSQNKRIIKGLQIQRSSSLPRQGMLSVVFSS